MTPRARGRRRRAAAVIDKRDHLRDSKPRGRAQAVAQRHAARRESFVRRENGYDRRQRLRDFLGGLGVGEPVRLGDSLVLVEIVERALNDVGRSNWSRKRDAG